MRENRNPNDVYVYGDPDFAIWLSGVIKTLINRRKMIAIVALLCLLISIIFNFAMIKPKYQSNVNSFFSIPEKVETPYGIFLFPSKSLADYGFNEQKEKALELTAKELSGEYTKEQLNGMTAVSIDGKSNTVEIKVSAKSDGEAYKIADIYEKNYFRAVNIILKRMALDTFISAQEMQYNISEKLFKDISEELKAANKILESVPKTITIENSILTSDQAALYFSAKSAGDMQNYKSGLIISQVVNPDYTSMSLLVNELKIDVNKNEGEMNGAKKSFEKLKMIKVSFEEGLATGIETDDAKGLLNFQQLILFPLSHSENYTENTGLGRFAIPIIALIVGLIIGGFIAFIQEFWNKVKKLLKE